jgi:hypothetical protein
MVYGPTAKLLACVALLVYRELRKSAKRSQCDGRFAHSTDANYASTASEFNSQAVSGVSIERSLPAVIPAGVLSRPRKAQS